MSSDQLLNEEEFLEEYEDSMDIIEMMLPKFEKGINESVVKCKSFLEGQDADGLKEEFHSLKGMVGNFYSPVLYHLAASMEEQAKALDFDGIKEGLDKFEDLCPKVLALVAGFVQKYAG